MFINRHLARSLNQALLIAGLSLCTAWPAAAQGDPHPVATSTAAAPPGETLGTVAGIQGAFRGSAFQTLLDASTDEKTATAVVGWKDGTSVYALTFKGPLGTKPKEATPISLDGLANGASVQFAANHMFWSGPSLEEQAAIAALCARVAPNAACDMQNLPPGKDRDRMADLLHLNDIPVYLGVSGGVSVTTYRFLSGAQLKETSDKKTDFSLSAQGGVFTPMFGFVIGTLGIQQTSQAGADSVSVCRPLPGTDATTCSNGVLKPPTDSFGALGSLQLRRKLAGNVAVAPIVQYDFKKDVTAFIVPVYFLKDAKGSPIGGVRGGWRSDTKAVVISMFVGAAFGLTP